jgi:hypothetical protein
MPQVTQVGLVACVMNVSELFLLGDLVPLVMIVPLSILTQTLKACVVWMLCADTSHAALTAEIMLKENAKKFSKR